MMQAFRRNVRRTHRDSTATSASERLRGQLAEPAAILDREAAQVSPDEVPAIDIHSL